jgi:hypothetical protein
MGFGSGYVVGWGTLALINAGLAQGKGRSGLNWFLLSLALGPLATLAIVALDRGDLTAPVKRAAPAMSVQLLAGGLILIAIALASFGLRH